MTDDQLQTLHNHIASMPAHQREMLGGKLLIRATERIKELENGIRTHRDFKGDDRCWMDDSVLYRLLPEGYEPLMKDSSVELENCKRFIACRQDPETEYVSPQRRIEELEAEVADLDQRLNDLLCRELPR